MPPFLRRRLLAAAISIAVPALGAGPPSAAAGAYDVRQCDYASGIGVHDLQWLAAGSPAIVPHDGGSGCGEFGLTARNSSPGHEQTYPSGGYGGWFALAPEGTRFTRFAGAFGTRSACCINGLATYAEATEGSDERSGRRAFLFQGHLGNASWEEPSGVSGPVGRSWSAATSGFAARRVGFYLRCGPGFSCFQRKTGDLRLRARSFEFTLRDDVAPTLAAPGGGLTAGGWLRGARALTFAAHDVGGGIARVEATFGTGARLDSPSACATAGGRYVRLTPCPPSRDGTWAVDTRRLPDGVHGVTVRAIDAGGAVASRALSVAVDNTPPGPPLAPALDGGEAWRADPRVALHWRNPGGQHAPVARVHYRACPVDPGPCVEGAHGGAGTGALDGLALPRAGTWGVTAWLEDAAGNGDPGQSSDPVRARFDPDPPALSFRPADPARPTEVVVEATDLSGVARGRVEVRRAGSGRWRGLPTAVVPGSLLRAEVDDATLRPGTYAIRATAVDLAGNRARVGGPSRTLPLRAAADLQALLAGRVPRSRLGCRPATSPRCRRLVTVRRKRLTLPAGATLAVRGRLRDASQTELGGRPIQIALASPGGGERVRTVRTDSRGGFGIRVRARRSAAVDIRYAGDATTLPLAVGLRLDVPAAVSMSAPREVIGGDPATFRGRVHGAAVLRRGKLVEIQARFRGRWRTISAVRTDRRGRWRFRYAFRAGAVVARYRLRAQAPAESGYPFATGRSRPVRVTVRPG